MSSIDNKSDDSILRYEYQISHNQTCISVSENENKISIHHMVPFLKNFKVLSMDFKGS